MNFVYWNCGMEQKDKEDHCSFLTAMRFKNAAYAVVNFRLARIQTFTSAMPIQCSNQLNLQTKWQLFILIYWFMIYPRKMNNG